MSQPRNPEQPPAEGAAICDDLVIDDYESEEVNSNEESEDEEEQENREDRDQDDADAAFHFDFEDTDRDIDDKTLRDIVARAFKFVYAREYVQMTLRETTIAYGNLSEWRDNEPLLKLSRNAVKYDKIAPVIETISHSEFQTLVNEMYRIVRFLWIRCNDEGASIFGRNISVLHGVVVFDKVLDLVRQYSVDVKFDALEYTLERIKKKLKGDVKFCSVEMMFPWLREMFEEFQDCKYKNPKMYRKNLVNDPNDAGLRAIMLAMMCMQCNKTSLQKILSKVSNDTLVAKYEAPCIFLRYWMFGIDRSSESALLFERQRSLVNGRHIANAHFTKLPRKIEGVDLTFRALLGCMLLSHAVYHAPKALHRTTINDWGTLQKFLSQRFPIGEHTDYITYAQTVLKKYHYKKILRCYVADVSQGAIKLVTDSLTVKAKPAVASSVRQWLPLTKWQWLVLQVALKNNICLPDESSITQDGKLLFSAAEAVISKFAAKQTPKERKVVYKQDSWNSDSEDAGSAAVPKGRRLSRSHAAKAPILEILSDDDDDLMDLLEDSKPPAKETSKIPALPNVGTEAPPVASDIANAEMNNAVVAAERETVDKGKSTETEPMEIGKVVAQVSGERTTAEKATAQVSDKTTTAEKATAQENLSAVQPVRLPHHPENGSKVFDVYMVPQPKETVASPAPRKRKMSDLSE